MFRSMGHGQKQQAHNSLCWSETPTLPDLCGKPLHKLLYVLSKKAQHKGGFSSTEGLKRPVKAGSALLKSDI